MVEHQINGYKRALEVFSAMVDARIRPNSRPIGWAVRTYLTPHIKKTAFTGARRGATQPEAWRQFIEHMRNYLPHLVDEEANNFTSDQVRTNILNVWRPKKYGDKRGLALGSYFLAHIRGDYADPQAALTIDLEILGQPFDALFGISVPNNLETALEAEEMLLRIRAQESTYKRSAAKVSTDGNPPIFNGAQP